MKTMLINVAKLISDPAVQAELTATIVTIKTLLNPPPIKTPTINDELRALLDKVKSSIAATEEPETENITVTTTPDIIDPDTVILNKMIDTLTEKRWSEFIELLTGESGHAISQFIGRTGKLVAIPEGKEDMLQVISDFGPELTLDKLSRYSVDLSLLHDNHMRYDTTRAVTDQVRGLLELSNMVGPTPILTPNPTPAPSIKTSPSGSFKKK